MSSNKDNKNLDIQEKKLTGIDKWIIDLSFLEGYIERSKKIFNRNNNQAEFIQTRILLDKYWKLSDKKVNSTFLYILGENDERYFLDNFFLYDRFIFKKTSLKDYDENCDYVYSSIIHPILFILNLAILLYFQDKRKSKYSDYVYTKYNFNYEQDGINFLSTNNLVFKEKYDNLLNYWNSVVKINIKNFYSSIVTDVFKKFVYDKYDIKWEILETIINYSKNVCSDGNKIFPTLEFSPLYSYLATSCVLEGVIEKIKKSISSIKIDILSCDNEIYLFFDDFSDWPKIKFIVENELFKYKLESNYHKIETIKINGNLVKNNNKKIKFSVFYIKLLEYFKDKQNFIESKDIFLGFLNENNLANPFYSFDIENLDLNDYKKILNAINSSNEDDYFKIIDSNPKHFIKIFYLLDRKYSHNFVNNYLLKRIVLNFKDHKYNSEIINENYYLYYYLYNSFKGLLDNEIDDAKFINTTDQNYVNFQTFICNIYDYDEEREWYSSLKVINYSYINIKHNKFLSSLMFFLWNKFMLHNYNDCILIVSTLYDLIKKRINKLFKIKSQEEFINYLNENILHKYKISKIIYKDWVYINKLRNKLSSCHIGGEANKNNDDFKLDDLVNTLLSIIKWIFNSSDYELNNNFNKFLFCIEKESKKNK